MSGAHESWDKYLDYQWLLGEANGNVIVLSGDIHRNVLPARHSDKVLEITSSGAARPGLGGAMAHLGGASGNFGLLTVLDAQVSVGLFSLDNPGGVEAQIKFGA
jgi:hypothetical protein